MAMKKIVNYNLGLDIGTSSIGYAAIDDQGRPVRHQNKTVMGVRLFKEGKTAESTRIFRGTRRRLSHRHWRLGYLDRIFDNEIAKVDENFLPRLKASKRARSDEKRSFRGSLLFPETGDDAYYQKYPTIYHLRYALITQKKQFDIRLIYLALHHMIKYRGNFLDTTPVSAFNIHDIDLTDQFASLNDCYQLLDMDFEFQFDLNNIEQVQKLLLDETLSKTKRQAAVSKVLVMSTGNKAFDDQQNGIASEFIKALLGGPFDLSKILNLSVADVKSWKLHMTDKNVDDTLNSLVEELDENHKQIVNLLQMIYSQVMMLGLLNGQQSISASMIERYDDHAKHWAALKKLLPALGEQEQSTIIHAYTAYTGHSRTKQLSRAEFYTKVNSILKKHENIAEATGLIELIDRNEFMPKQRDAVNGVIPHQLHQRELQLIIQNQQKYYPFLAAKAYPDADETMIEQLLSFRVPYYAGPLVDRDFINESSDQEQAMQNTKFSWLKRREAGEITPWNFEQKVDVQETANRFIKRLTTKDTYLMTEDVLPKESLIYQRFEVLNELNAIRINDRRLTAENKQLAFQQLFMAGNTKNVSIKKFRNFVFDSLKFPEKVKITGFAGQHNFLAKLSTYHDFKKIFGERVDHTDLQPDFERIVEWCTIFEDRHIYREKLKEIQWLSQSEIDQLVLIRNHGWGRLSKRLLTGIRDSDGRTVMDQLWFGTDNFMRIISQSDFAAAIANENRTQLNQHGLEDVLDSAFMSPQNKKAIRQVLKVVDDIEQTLGCPPKKVMIEFTRSPDKKKQRTVTRLEKVQQAYKAVADQLAGQSIVSELDQYANTHSKLSDTYYLYFMQLGRDLYSGKPIDIDSPMLDDDHILPRAFMKDNSLDNRALTEKPINNTKAAKFPSKVFGQQKEVTDFWKLLRRCGLMSNIKEKHLYLDPDNVDKWTRRGFIHRQLVETSQVIKIVANILNDRYQQSQTEVLEVPARLGTELRECFGWYKVREVNDYHHVFDAYLAAFIGNYLYRRYPKLQPYFVYGNFAELNKAQLKNIKSFNFLYNITDNKRVVKDIETGQTLWDDQIRQQIQHIYEYKYMLTSHEAFTQHKELYGQTIYPRREFKPGTLKAIKQDQPQELYGGYKNLTAAYMCIVKIQARKRRAAEYRVVRVATESLSALQQAKRLGVQAYERCLRQELVRNNEILRTNADPNSAPREFEVLLDRVLCHQMIISDGQKYLLGSHAYKINCMQLVLSNNSMKILSTSIVKLKQMTNEPLVQVYREILDVVNKYFTLYDVNSFRENLNQFFDKFRTLPITNEYESSKSGKKLIHRGQLETLTLILRGLHANSDKVQYGDQSTLLGGFQTKDGIKLSKDSVIQYTSPAGLNVRTVKLRDLEQKEAQK
ncbi:type II CRISPR RNA-guided endonuclease Cas9 [Lactiplantibacillus pentosus]|uniref:type II CRISPR RNA-guided endonuclease Cas9 n=2 Tax=Lactiplantibacillus pentosus TaxID=1589 RepID=UPI000D014086|nr:type II CRISPR RNA-guided endonuclease Cas9 [Lactiplantibacillus pentosus]PRO78765.1 type II CRISPR RNA-guided endonuclease Cas9 [Lactiplantibacillus pentosus]PRO87974.1 type II CRISPR RNA-guided endonuclease Cas9 [Lactiplantibacillus pentosus]